MRFENKGVVVTGATGGIGRETCLQFAAEGAAVAVTDLDLKLAERLASEIEEKGGKAVGYELDVTDQEQTDTIVEQAANDLGSIDIIFCNAGIREIEPAHQLPLDEWRKVIDVNVTGVFVSAQSFAKHCISKGKPGVIINTASTLGVMGSTSRCAYSTSKHAVVGMTKSLAIEYAKKNLNLNCISPGFIETSMTDKISENVKTMLISRIPMSKLGSGEDVANSTAFLCSDLASYITGETIHVNGGMYMA